MRIEFWALYNLFLNRHPLVNFNPKLFFLHFPERKTGPLFKGLLLGQIFMSILDLLERLITIIAGQTKVRIISDTFPRVALFLEMILLNEPL
jgi:hypothetical protein